MPTPKPKRKRPGYEPALGRPDPADQPPPPVPAPGYETHYPHSNGAVCGQVFTHAKYYDPVRPTCATCAQWLAAAKRVTAARHPPESAPPPAAETTPKPEPSARRPSPPPASETSEVSPPTPRDRPSQTHVPDE